MNTIIHGDCLEKMNDIADCSIDAVISDFPYGKTNAPWDKKLDLRKVWGHYRRICKPNAAIILFGYQDFTAELIMSNREWYKYTMVWRKRTVTNYLNAKKQPLREHEDIVVFYNKQCTYNPQKTTGHPRKVSTAAHKRNSKATELYGSHGKTTYDSTERYPTSILTFPLDKQKQSLTSTQKPIALLKHLALTYTNEGDTILDNCAGSGGMAEAAELIGRDCICIDNDIEKVNIAIQRLNKEQVA